jgi:hypothetical protein
LERRLIKFLAFDNQKCSSNMTNVEERAILLSPRTGVTFITVGAFLPQRPMSILSSLKCGVATYNLTIQKKISPADLQLFGLSQAYLEAFRPAALAITYGHMLNARPEACGQPAGSSPFLCTPSSQQMVSQTNLISIQVKILQF